MRNILCLLPHCDDEFFIKAHLKRWVSEKCHVKVVILTYDPQKQALRQEETQNFLSELGVHDVEFLCKKKEIPDGGLVYHLTELEELLNIAGIDTLVTPALEGGHQDHDVAFLFAEKMRKQSQVENHLYFYTYNGEGTVGKFFKVNTPVKSEMESYSEMRVPRFSSAFDSLRKYPSQFVTWSGLAPFYFLKLSKDPYERLYRADESKVKYKGTPLYERYGRMTQSKFLDLLVGPKSKKESM